MEPTSEPENTRQSRGLARFWPVHGIPTPAPRQSDEDPDASQATAAGAAAHASDQPAGAAGPTGEHPQVSDQQSHPHDDQQDPDEQSPNPFAPRPHPALTSDTQMVALGSRRPADALLGGNGARWTNQGGFPQVETNGHRNGDAGPRHGGTPVANGQLPGSRSPFAPGGDNPPPPPFAQPGDDAARSAFIPTGNEESARSAFIPNGNEESPRSAFIPTDDAAPGARPPFTPAGNDGQPGSRPPFAPTGNDGPPGSRSPFAPAGNDGQPGSRSPFAPAEDDGPAGPAFAPSPFAPQSSGSAPVTSAGAGQPAAPAVPPQQAARPQQPARPVSATPTPSAAGSAQVSAAGSAQVPMPMPGRPVSTPPAPAPAAVPHVLKADPSAPTRLEPTGWATAGPRAGASGSAAVPVSAPAPGRRSRDDEAAEQAALTPRRSAAADDRQPVGLNDRRPAGADDRQPVGLDDRRPAGADDRQPVGLDNRRPAGADDRQPVGLDNRRPAGAVDRLSAGVDDRLSAGADEAALDRRPGRAETAETPLRPGDVNDISITFWAESASEQFRAEWHEVKAQFVDDPVAALTRAHDLLTEAVHELTESMLAERDDLDPLQAGAKPDTESMRMAMRGYREFLDRILAL